MKIGIDSCIPVIVEGMLPVFTDNRILNISIRCDFSHYFADEEIESNKVKNDFLEENPSGECRFFTCHSFLFYRPSNYTAVFYSEDEGFIGNTDKKYVCTSYHDSCWKSDGLRPMLKRHREYQKIFEEDIKSKYAQGADLRDICIREPHISIELLKIYNAGLSFKSAFDYILNNRDEKIILFVEGGESVGVKK